MADEAPAIFDRAAFDRQIGGDTELRNEIVQMFLEDCPQRVAEIGDAIAQGDAAALKSAAHALKGSAAYMAAPVVRARAGDLEQLGRDGRLADAPAVFNALSVAVALLLPELRKLES